MNCLPLLKMVESRLDKLFHPCSDLIPRFHKLKGLLMNINIVLIDVNKRGPKSVKFLISLPVIVIHM